MEKGRGRTLQHLALHEEALAHLREALEVAAGRKMVVPRDFERLSELILEKGHEKVSCSTLKRLWGYLKDGSMPRESTLDILSQFLGHKDWQAFCRSIPSPETLADVGKDNQHSGTDTPSVVPAKSLLMRRLLLFGLPFVMLVVLVGVGVSGMLHFPERGNLADADTSGILLRMGDTYDTPDAYLRLFGITPTDTYWDMPLPHQQNIIVWSPQYHHPRWHNEGNADSLCPTITEYWSPTSGEANSVAPELTRQKNQNLYFTVMRTNELRITFMRGLRADSVYTFLGVYRINTSQSDSTHLVWQRIADQLNLAHLDYLEQLRN